MEIDLYKTQNYYLHRMQPAVISRREFCKYYFNQQVFKLKFYISTFHV